MLGATIPDRREATQGTARAQLTPIYLKADVSTRAQFTAYFVENPLGQGGGATP